MSARRLGSPLVMDWFAAALVMILGVVWFGTSEAAQNSLVNCNEVLLVDRCACNDRILLALAQSRPVFADAGEGGGTGDVNAAIAIQAERDHRLRIFHAPICEGNSSEKDLPISPQHTGTWLDQKSVQNHLPPLGVQTLAPAGAATQGSVSAQDLLPGRWEGWQTLFGRKPTPISLHVISTEAQGRFVRACSDQGLVFGRVKDGYLELPRSDFADLAYSIRLWNSRTLHSQGLHGVTLLEVRPGRVVVAGLVWLSRVERFDWTTPPSSYFCQDRDLEERRKEFLEKQEGQKEKKGTLPLIRLNEEVQQLRRELEALRIELDIARSQGLVGDVDGRGPSLGAK